MKNKIIIGLILISIIGIVNADRLGDCYVWDTDMWLTPKYPEEYQSQIVHLDGEVCPNQVGNKSAGLSADWKFTSIDGIPLNTTSIFYMINGNFVMFETDSIDNYYPDGNTYLYEVPAGANGFSWIRNDTEVFHFNYNKSYDYIGGSWMEPGYYATVFFYTPYSYTHTINEYNDNYTQSGFLPSIFIRDSYRWSMNVSNYSSFDGCFKTVENISGGWANVSASNVYIEYEQGGVDYNNLLFADGEGWAYNYTMNTSISYTISGYKVPNYPSSTALTHVLGSIIKQDIEDNNCIPIILENTGGLPDETTNQEIIVMYENGSFVDNAYVILVSGDNSSEGYTETDGGIIFEDLPINYYSIFAKKEPKYPLLEYFTSQWLDGTPILIYLETIIEIKNMNLTTKLFNYGDLPVQNFGLTYYGCVDESSCMSTGWDEISTYCNYIGTTSLNASGEKTIEKTVTDPNVCMRLEYENIGQGINIRTRQSKPTQGETFIEFNVSLGQVGGNATICAGFMDSVTYDYINSVSVTVNKYGVWVTEGLSSDVGGDGKYKFCWITESITDAYDIIAVKTNYQGLNIPNDVVGEETFYAMDPLSGNVSPEYRHTLGGIIYDQDNAPLSSVKVYLDCTEGYTYANNSGYYNYTGLIQGKDCCVSVNDAGYTTGRDCLTIVGENNGFNIYVEELDENDYNVEFHVVETDPFSTNSFLDIHNANVHIQRSGYPSKRCITDNSGRCTIHDVIYEQSYNVEVTKDGFETSAQTIQLKERSYQIQLYSKVASTCKVTGTVIIENLTTKNPAQNVIVELFDKSGNKISQTETDGLGKYTISLICLKGYEIRTSYGETIQGYTIITESAEGQAVKQDFAFKSKDKEWEEQVEEAVDFLKLLYPFFYVGVMLFGLIVFKKMTKEATG